MQTLFVLFLSLIPFILGQIPPGYVTTEPVGRPQARAACLRLGGELAAINSDNISRFPSGVGVCLHFVNWTDTPQAFWVDSWNTDTYQSPEGLLFSPPAHFSVSATDSRGLPLFVSALCSVRRPA